ncbi:AraC family transcriptional regulator, partial [Synechocystis salina LEGE 06155]|nr:AraC family transcriptional regulator [Synechocystis salina LEGE 06155]
PTVKLGDIASQLGYKHSTHFTRAFKQWTGETPQHFRQQMLANFNAV